MRAIRCTAYGPPEVLKIVEVPKPTPKEGEVLIGIKASTVTMGDCEIRNLTLPLWTRIPMRLLVGYSKPRSFIPGMEMSGVVVSVGKGVKSFKEGDAVFGSSGMRMGANAEYICRPATRGLAAKPPEASFDDVATIPVGAINAFHFLRKADIRPGQSVLVIGGGGCIGTYGVLLAKLFGAEVTAVDSTPKLGVLKSIGADHVIDYTKEDFSAGNTRYDVVFDLVYSSSFDKCMSVLGAKGTYLMGNTGPRRMMKAALTSKRNGKKIFFDLAAEPVPDLEYLADLIATKKLKPVIDKVFRFDQIVEAHRYVESGRKTGCVVISHTA